MTQLLQRLFICIILLSPALRYTPALATDNSKGIQIAHPIWQLHQIYGVDIMGALARHQDELQCQVENVPDINNVADFVELLVNLGDHEEPNISVPKNIELPTPHLADSFVNIRRTLRNGTSILLQRSLRFAPRRSPTQYMWLTVQPGMQSNETYKTSLIIDSGQFDKNARPSTGDNMEVRVIQHFGSLSKAITNRSFVSHSVHQFMNIMTQHQINGDPMTLMHAQGSQPLLTQDDQGQVRLNQLQDHTITIYAPSGDSITDISEERKTVAGHLHQTYSPGQRLHTQRRTGTTIRLSLP